MQEDIINSRFPSSEYLRGKQPKQRLEVVKKLLLSIPPCSSKSSGWSFKQHKVTMCT